MLMKSMSAMKIFKIFLTMLLFAAYAKATLEFEAYRMF